MKRKYATDCVEAFKKMIKSKQPENVRTDKGTGFKGVSKTFYDKKGINLSTTESETKPAFAERNIRSLKNLIYQYPAENWTWIYFDDLQKFVNTITAV